MFYKSTFYKFTFYKSMFYKSTFYKSMFYKSMFYKSTFYKSTFYKSTPCFKNPLQSTPLHSTPCFTICPCPCFVAAICRTNSNQFELVRQIAATNSVAATMIITCHTRRFVAATCRGDLSQRFVASCVSALNCFYLWLLFLSVRKKISTAFAVSFKKWTWLTYA